MPNSLNRPFLLYLLLIVVVLASCGKGARKPDDLPVVIDTPKTLFNLDSLPHEISNRFTFTEGASVDKDGNVFFVDQPNSQIWKYATNGTLSLFMDHSGYSNGMFIDKNGKLIACADEHNELWEIDIATHAVKVLVTNYMGKLLNGPNDVWVHPNGTIYFTDPFYARAWWTRVKKTQLTSEGVYYMPAGAAAPVELVDTLKKPNGILGTPDGKFLFVADISANLTYKYTINADGKLSNGKLFCRDGSDGMALDNFGNLYLTNGNDGVHVYNTKGEKVITIPVPKIPSNVCFSGKDKNILFITARQSIYTLKMNVKGVE
jgi:gluconolactonase